MTTLKRYKRDVCIVATIDIVASIIISILISHLLISLPKIDDVSILPCNCQRKPQYEPIVASFPIVHCLVLQNRHAVVIEHYSCSRKYSKAAVWNMRESWTSIVAGLRKFNYGP